MKINFEQVVCVFLCQLNLRTVETKNEIFNYPLNCVFCHQLYSVTCSLIDTNLPIGSDIAMLLVVQWKHANERREHLFRPNHHLHNVWNDKITYYKVGKLRQSSKNYAIVKTHFIKTPI